MATDAKVGVTMNVQKASEAKPEAVRSIPEPEAGESGLEYLKRVREALVQQLPHADRTPETLR